MNSERNLFDYLSPQEFARIKEFTKDKASPCLVIDLKRIEARYDELKKYLPYAKVYYAVKANPHDEVIKLLARKGSCFDVATIYEMEQLFRLGVSADRMSFGNTIKKEEDIAFAYKNGIRLFASDSISDLQKISRQAPDAKIFFRIIRESGGADWPLSKKFGAYPDMVYHLILEAKKLGLTPYGISFHVGSQQRDIGQWDDAIAQCKYLFDSAKEEGVQLKLINMGGGFPSSYLQPTFTVDTYAKEITRFLHEDFGDELPEIIVEPGRSLTADSGVIVSEIVMISKKSERSLDEWMYLDIGKFGGMIETLDESIKFPIFVENHDLSKGSRQVILAGPTCDSADILYEKNLYKFPLSTKEGDRVYILSTGAYTQSYSSIYFNGFPPLKAYILE